MKRHIFSEHYDEQKKKNSNNDGDGSEHNEENNDGAGTEDGNCNGNCNGNSDGNSNSGSSDGNNENETYHVYEGFIYVINIKDAAELAQDIRLDTKQDFLGNYDLYGNGYVSSNIVSLNNFTYFLCYKYGAVLVDNVNDSDELYFAFRKSHISGKYYYYDIYTRNKSLTNEDYEYVYVFK